MNFVHMSDLHLRVTEMKTQPAFPAEKLVDDGTKLRAALRRARAQEQAPDFMLFSGDLVHEGTAADYRHLKRILDEELGGGVPYFLALGNHDRRGAFWEGFMGQAGRSGPYYAGGEIGGLRVISLDSSPTDGSVVGRFPADQLAFLQAELKIPAPKGRLVLCHHPVACVSEGFGAHLVTEGEAFVNALRGGGVRAVFAGHTHFTDVHAAGNVLFVTASSTCFGLDLADRETIAFTGASSYINGRIAEDRVFVSPVDAGAHPEILFRMDARALYQTMTQ